MVLIARLSSILMRNLRSCVRTSVRHYDSEPGGEEIKSTTVTMLSKQDDDYLYVEAYSEVGFRLSSGFRILGPCVLFPRSVLHWAIAGVHEVNEKSLSLFPVLEPKLDLLILGIGEHGAKYDKNIIKFLRNHKINVEILPTDQACSTFNFLNSERRMVAAGLIPPTYLKFDLDEDLMVRGPIEGKKSIYEFEYGYTGSSLDNQPGEFTKHLERLGESGLGNRAEQETEETPGDRRDRTVDSEKERVENKGKSDSGDKMT